jgi:hypothetical protein
VKGWAYLWPPHSPDFLLLGVTKGALYLPPLATILSELAGKIRAAVATVTRNFLKNVCIEINTVTIYAGPPMMPCQNNSKMEIMKTWII